MQRPETRYTVRTRQKHRQEVTTGRQAAQNREQAHDEGEPAQRRRTAYRGAAPQPNQKPCAAAQHREPTGVERSGVPGVEPGHPTGDAGPVTGSE